MERQTGNNSEEINQNIPRKVRSGLARIDGELTIGLGIAPDTLRPTPEVAQAKRGEVTLQPGRKQPLTDVPSNPGNRLIRKAKRSSGVRYMGQY